MEIQDGAESSEEQKSNIDQEINEEDSAETSPDVHNNGYQRSLTESNDVINSVTSSSPSSFSGDEGRKITWPIQFILLLMVLLPVFWRYTKCSVRGDVW